MRVYGSHVAAETFGCSWASRASLCGEFSQSNECQGARTHPAHERQNMFEGRFQVVISQTRPDQVLRVLNLRGCVRGYCAVRVCLRRTSSVCTSHGGGGDDLSYSRMVSSVTLLYLKSVSGPSWRSNACRRYLQPRSVGVPGHEDTLSVSSQSEVSSALRTAKLAPRVRQTVQEVTHSTESGLRASRRHWRVRCPKRSVMSSLRQRAVAIARLNKLFWASRMIIDGGDNTSPAVRAVSEDAQGARGNIPTSGRQQRGVPPDQL